MADHGRAEDEGFCEHDIPAGIRCSVCEERTAINAAVSKVFEHVIDGKEAHFITQDGRRVAVILPIEDYEQMRDAFVLQEVRWGHTTEVPLEQ